MLIPERVTKNMLLKARIPQGQPYLEAVSQTDTNWWSTKRQAELLEEAFLIRLKKLKQNVSDASRWIKINREYYRGNRNCLLLRTFSFNVVDED